MASKPLKVSERLRKALPALTAEEKKQLKACIEADGVVTDPILWAMIDGEKVIVDGMHRFEIAIANDIPYKTAKAPASVGTTIAEAELWIWDRALGRRNLLDPAAVRKLRGQMYNRLKRDDAGHGKQEKKQEASPPDKGPTDKMSDGPPDGGGGEESNAAEIVAKKAGVTTRTVERDGAYVEDLESCVKQIQTMVENKYAAPTAAEMKWLAKRTEETQNTIARDVRTGKTLAQAMAPHKRKRSSGGGGKAKTSAATLVDTATKKLISPLAKALTKIARANGGEGDQFKRAHAGLNECIKGLNEMRKGKQ